MALITCRGLAFAYGAETVLSGVDFAVEAGDYLCIVGENGSGKSTLVKGLLGLKEPSAGSITLGDGLQRREIGYLPQQTALQRDFPASVFEVVLSGRLNSLGRRCFYSKADRAEAERELERMGMAEFKNRCYQDLSGGQQQRVLLARALCAADDLLMLDEPVAALDPEATEGLYEVIRMLHRERGMAVLMISHDVQAAVRDADRVVVLDRDVLFNGTRQAYAQWRKENA